MNLKNKLERKFYRVLIESARTKFYEELEQHIREDLRQQVSEYCSVSECVVASYVAETDWLVVALSKIIWRVGDVIQVLDVDRIDSVTVDMKVNKEQGFTPGEGFRVFSVKEINGETHNIFMEPGSALEAVYGVIKDLLAGRENFPFVPVDHLVPDTLRRDARASPLTLVAISSTLSGLTTVMDPLRQPCTA